MGYNRRGVRDRTGPYRYSYERLSGRGGRRAQCYRRTSPIKRRTARKKTRRPIKRTSSRTIRRLAFRFPYW